MKTKPRVHLLFLALLSLAGFAHGQGTAFTYQGRLTDQGAPANAIYDLRRGLVVAGPVDAGDVGVTNGLFTLTLDFGANVFNGGDRWLEIGVRPGTSTGAYTTVAPLQKITATPYAIRAAHFSGPVAARQITGTLAPPNIGVGTITSSKLASGAAAANLNSSGQSGVASGGIILSSNANSAELLNADYIKFGQTELGERWQARNLSTAPSARYNHTAVWTGSEMIIWGGYDGTAYVNTGARYNPAANNWSPMNTGGAPAGRYYHRARPIRPGGMQGAGMANEEGKVRSRDLALGGSSVRRS